MLGQEALAENNRHLEERVGFLVEIEILLVGRAAKNGVVGVIFHRIYFLIVGIVSLDALDYLENLERLEGGDISSYVA